MSFPLFPTEFTCEQLDILFVEDLLSVCFTGNSLTATGHYTFVAPQGQNNPLANNASEYGVITSYTNGQAPQLSVYHTSSISGPTNSPAENSVEYTVYTFVVKDGDLLRKVYNKLVVKPRQLVFLLEDNVGDTVSPATMFCRAGSDWRQLINGADNLANDESFNEYLRDIYAISSEDVLTLITTGEIKMKNLDVLDFVGKVFFWTTAVPNYLASKAIIALANGLIKGLEKLKYEKDDWLPQDKKGEKFKPVFFTLALSSPNDKLSLKEAASSVMAGPGNLAVLTAEMQLEALKLIENKLNEIYQKIQTYPQKDKKKNKVITSEFVRKMLQNLSGFVQGALQFVKELREGLEFFLHLGVNIVNAYFCGLVNGFIDGVNGLLTLVKWVFELNKTGNEILKDIKGKLPTALEVIDNFLNAFSQFSFANLWKAIKKQVSRFLETVWGEMVDGVNEQEMCTLAYVAGNIVGMIIEAVAEILLTGGAAALTKVFETLGSAGARVQEIFIKTAKAVLNLNLKQAGKDMIDGLRTFAKLLSSKVADIEQFIKQFLDEIRRLFKIGLNPETEAVFERLNLTYKRIKKPLTTAVLVPIPVTENVYVVYHKGIEIFRGAKAGADELAETVGKMSDEAAEKYLDDLAGFTPKLIGNFWEWTNLAGTRLRRLNQVLPKVNIANDVKQALNAIESSKRFEGAVAQEVSKYERLTDFSNKVEVLPSKGKFGEIDMATDKFLIEVKERIAEDVLGEHSRKFLKQFYERYLDPLNRNYINNEGKKVVLVIGKIDKELLKHPVLQKLSEDVIIIDDLANLGKIFK